MASKRQELATALRRRLMETHPPREPQLRALGDAVDVCLGGGLKCGALHEVFPAAAADFGEQSLFLLPDQQDQAAKVILDQTSDRGGKAAL